MFALSYVILPFSDILPADAIRASLAPFQRGPRGTLPESWLSFRDETEALLEDYEARLTINAGQWGDADRRGSNLVPQHKEGAG